MPVPLEPVSFPLLLGLGPSDVGVQLPVAGSTFPARLDPGETLLMSLSFITLDKPMYACLLAQRYDLKDSLYLRLSTCNGTLISLAEKISSVPPTKIVLLGPVTNRPPDTITAHLPRVARP